MSRQGSAESPSRRESHRVRTLSLFQVPFHPLRSGVAWCARVMPDILTIWACCSSLPDRFRLRSPTKCLAQILDGKRDAVYEAQQTSIKNHAQEAKVHRRAVNNWHVARVAAERELTTDMLGTQRK